MRLILGLDLGNQNFRAVVGTQTKNFQPQVLDALEIPANGLAKGVVVDYEDFLANLTNIFQKLKELKYSPKYIFINVSDPHTTLRIAKSAVGVSRADNQISDFDIEQLYRRCQESTSSHNKILLHLIPREYVVDDLKGIKDPVGMHGIKVELESLIIEGFIPHLKTIQKAFEELKRKITEPVFTPLASARSCLSKKQKEVGVALIDIGADTTSLAVFEDDKLLTANVFPVGSNHITQDIAICLKTSLEIAEKIKLTFGCASADEVSRKEIIDLTKISKEFEGGINRRFLSEIIEARLEEIFDFVNEELKKINRSARLPAGVVLVGGGSRLPEIVNFVKNYLRLPARLGHPINLNLENIRENLAEILDDPTFAVANGLFLWGIDYLNTQEGKLITPPSFLSKIKKFFRIFLP